MITMMISSTNTSYPPIPLKTQVEEEERRLRSKDEQAQETQQVQQLVARDREVRLHEQAHAAAGGIYTGSPSYTFEVGPNGMKYAVGGHLPNDTSKAGSPEETVAKAQIIQRAAMAPAQPSGQDRQVAAQAQQMETEARQEILDTAQREVRNALRKQFQMAIMNPEEGRFRPEAPSQASSNVNAISLHLNEAISIAAGTGTRVGSVLDQMT